MTAEEPDKMETQTVLTIFLMNSLVAIYAVALLIILLKKVRTLFQKGKIRFYIIVLLNIFARLAICALITAKIVLGVHSEFKSLSSSAI